MDEKKSDSEYLDIFTKHVEDHRAMRRQRNLTEISGVVNDKPFVLVGASGIGDVRQVNDQTS